jgi:acyl carrier protein
LHDLSGVPREQLDPAASFLDLGFDSLFLTQARQAFGREFGVKITFRS